MCELFAINAKEPVEANGLLRLFFPHSVNHPDGWGIGWREGDEVAVVKEPVPAHESAMLAERLESPIRAAHLIAHIRKATCGERTVNNCHPFVEEDESGIEWMMAHNGAIFNDALISGYDRVSQGETDSERVMLFLLDVLDTAALRAGGHLGFEERFKVLASAVEKLSNGNKLNLIFDDGEYTYVHTNTVENTLHMRLLDESSAAFSTVPLDGSGWAPIPQRCLIAVKDGQIVHASSPHLNCITDDVLHRFLFEQLVIGA